MRSLAWRMVRVLVTAAVVGIPGSTLGFPFPGDPTNGWLNGWDTWGARETANVYTWVPFSDSASWLAYSALYTEAWATESATDYVSWVDSLAGGWKCGGHTHKADDGDWNNRNSAGIATHLWSAAYARVIVKHCWWGIIIVQINTCGGGSSAVEGGYVDCRGEFIKSADSRCVFPKNGGCPVVEHVDDTYAGNSPHRACTWAESKTTGSVTGIVVATQRASICAG